MRRLRSIFHVESSALIAKALLCNKKQTGWKLFRDFGTLLSEVGHWFGGAVFFNSEKQSAKLIEQKSSFENKSHGLQIGDLGAKITKKNRQLVLLRNEFDNVSDGGLTAGGVVLSNFFLWSVIEFL